MKITFIVLTLAAILLTSCRQITIWDKTTKSISIEFRLVKNTSVFYITKSNLESQILINNTDIKDAFVDKRDEGFVIVLEMTSSGSKKLKHITTTNIGKRIAIVVDDRIETTPMIIDTVYDGTVIITGKYTYKEASDTASGIMKYNDKKIHNKPL
jgi:preprotein translocase subunit SecD